jgi:hypothetical protein
LLPQLKLGKEAWGAGGENVGSDRDVGKLSRTYLCGVEPAPSKKFPEARPMMIDKQEGT